ncbi:hypothetical protein [Saccharibacillus qingshengii]|nr:hypothetical protein [Saccharibacillus qingshengii]
MAEPGRRIVYDNGDGGKVQVVMLALELRQECMEELTGQLARA